MPLVPSQLRIAAKCLMVQRRHPFIHRRNRDFDRCQSSREFSHSSSRHAAEDPASIMAQLQASPLIRKIADKPEALKALNDFANLLRDADVSLTPDKPPSTMQMIKLAANPKFREGAKRVIEELKNAGIEINSENAFELFGMKRPGR